MTNTLKVLALSLALSLAFGAAPLAAQGPLQGAGLPGPLPLFPGDNWWNADISAAPVDPASQSYIDFIGATKGMHPDFGGEAGGGAIYGMPYITVPGTQPLVPVTFVEFGDQSDAGAPGRPAGYPIPEEAKLGSRWIEGGAPGTQAGGDRHMLIVDRDNRILYELYHTRWNAGQNRWEAGSGAVWPLDQNLRRPEGWTSADAAGLAILPGLVRYDEVASAAPIQHAFRFTVRDSNSYVYPASHDAGDRAGAPPMGLRLRLKASKDISGFSPEIRKIFQAMKTYGLIMADNGSDMYVQGSYNTGWNNDTLNPAFNAIKAGDFEVIQLGWKPGLTPPVQPPSAPANLAATAQSSSQVGLTWSDNSTNEQSFRIEMKSGAGAFAEVSSVAAGVTSTAIGGLAAETAYTFRVRARNASGDSPYSNQAVATTLAAPPVSTPPAAPSGLTATAQSSSQVVLNWADNSNNEQTFRIEAKSGAGAFSEVSSAGAGVNTMTVGGFAASTAYTFRVRARNAAGDSAYSNQAVATTQTAGGGTGPCVPGDLKLCLAGGRFAVTATWRQPNGASGSGHASPLTSDTGFFWFFSATNVETVVKVLNACGVNQRYWVFAGGLTNVRTEITVTDTQTGLSKTYTNPQSTPFQPIQDTSAFVCP